MADRCRHEIEPPAVTHRGTNSADAQLRHPRRFAREAKADFMRAGPIGWRLFVANLQSRHRRAYLGYFWLILPTLLIASVWVFLQSNRLIGVGEVGMPYPVYVLSGLLLWQFFLDVLNAPISRLSTDKMMFTRGRTPLEAHVVAGLLEACLGCGLRLLLLVPVMLLFGVSPGSGALLLPLGLFALALLGLSIGTMLAPLGLLYDDVGRGMALVTTVWFFLTPIVYAAPAGSLVRLNPVTPLLETTRLWLTGTASPSGFAVVQLAGIALAAAVVLTVGLLLLRVARPHLVARLG
jgi:lipopolysaccharide transport system permease protein